MAEGSSEVQDVSLGQGTNSMRRGASWLRRAANVFGGSAGTCIATLLRCQAINPLRGAAMLV